MALDPQRSICADAAIRLAVSRAVASRHHVLAMASTMTPHWPPQSAKDRGPSDERDLQVRGPRDVRAELRVGLGPVMSRPKTSTVWAGISTERLHPRLPLGQAGTRSGRDRDLVNEAFHGEAVGRSPPRSITSSAALVEGYSRRWTRTRTTARRSARPDCSPNRNRSARSTQSTAPRQPPAGNPSDLLLVS